MLGNWQIAGYAQMVGDFALAGGIAVIVQVGYDELQHLQLAVSRFVITFLFVGIHIDTIHNSSGVCQEVGIADYTTFVYGVPDLDTEETIFKWAQAHYTNQEAVMTKAEFVASVAEKTGLTKVAAAEAVDAFICTVTEVVKAGDKITFPGFGAFSVAERAARIGRNPQTGAELKIAASKSGKFSAGKDLKGL